MEQLNKLTPLADDGVIKIKTIQGLATAPELKADELKKAFDTNVYELCKAIDEYVIDPINTANPFTASDIPALGGGDMHTDQYARYSTGKDPSSSLKVDKALHADTADMATEASSAVLASRVSVSVDANGVLYIGE